MLRFPHAEPLVRAILTLGQISEDDVWDIQGIYYKEHGMSRQECMEVPLTTMLHRLGIIAERKQQERREMERANKRGARQPDRIR